MKKTQNLTPKSPLQPPLVQHSEVHLRLILQQTKYLFHRDKNKSSN